MAEIKEFHATGESAIRPDRPMTDRQVVVVVMKHPTEEKYLCTLKHKFGWIDFVMGGIEGDETPLEAGARELVEESGYTDFGELKVLDDVYYDNFYAAHKDVNRHITVHTVYGKLKSLEQQERSPEEQEIADVIWLSTEELPSKLHTDAHRWDLERVLALEK